MNTGVWKREGPESSVEVHDAQVGGLSSGFPLLTPTMQAGPAAAGQKIMVFRGLPQASLSSESGESLRHAGYYPAKGVWGIRP